MFPGIRGIPGWAAVLLIVAFVGLSYAIDWNKPILGRPLTILYFAGCVLAVLLVRRKGLFWPAVVPPIVGAIGVPLFYLLTATPLGETLGRADVLTALVPLAKRFPLILVTWLIVLAIAVVRGLVLEPNTTRSSHPLAERVRDRVGLGGTRGGRGRPAPKRSAAAASRGSAKTDTSRTSGEDRETENEDRASTSDKGASSATAGTKEKGGGTISAAAAARAGDRPRPPIRRTSPKHEPTTTAEKLSARRGESADKATPTDSPARRAGSRRVAGEPHSERGRRIRRED